MANQVRIGVGVDDKASRPIHDIHDAFLRLQRDGAKGLGIGLGAAAGLQAFNAAGSAIHEVTGFLKESVSAAIDEEAGIKKLDASLRANVATFSGSTTAIEANIASREALAFSDDDLRGSLALLVGATHDVEKAQTLQATAMDLARFKGIDLASASEALIKVEGGQYRSLKALGIVLKDGATATEALAAVQAVAGGQAQAFSETTAGAMESANIAIDDLQEEIGAKLAPAIKDAADVIRNDIVPAISTMVDVAGRATPVIEGMARVLGLIGQGPSDETKAEADHIANMIKAIGSETTARLSSRDAADSQAVSFYNADQAAKANAGSLDLAARAELALVVATGTAANASEFQKQAAQDAMAAFKELGTVFDGFNSVVTEGSAHMGIYGADLDNAAMRAIGLTTQIDDLGASLDALPREIDISLKYNVDTSAMTNPTLAGTADADRRNAFSSGGDAEALRAHSDATASERAARAKVVADAQAAAEKNAREAKSAADKAAAEAERKAEQAAREHARAVHEQLNAAYDKLKDKGAAALDLIHDKNLKLAQDTHDQANALLDAQEIAIRGKVSGEEKKLAAERSAAREKDLRQAVTDAKDPAAHDAAISALNDFLADQRIAFLNARADEAIAGLDAEKAKNDAALTAAKEREDARYKAAKKGFDDELKLLKTHLDKSTAEYNVAFKEIAAAAKKWGVANLMGIHPVAGLPAATKPAAGSATVNTNGRVLSGDAVDAAVTPRLFQGTGSQPAIHTHVYLNGREIATAVTAAQAGEGALRNPMPVSTGLRR